MTARLFDFSWRKRIYISRGTLPIACLVPFSKCLDALFSCTLFFDPLALPFFGQIVNGNEGQNERGHHLLLGYWAHAWCMLSGPNFAGSTDWRFLQNKHIIKHSQAYMQRTHKPVHPYLVCREGSCNTRSSAEQFLCRMKINIYE